MAKFTAAERKRRAARMHLSGVARKSIATQLGVSEKTIHCYLREKDLLCEKQDLSEREQEILSALACGWTWDEVASELHVAKKTIAALVSKQPPEKFFEMPKPDEIIIEKHRLFWLSVESFAEYENDLHGLDSPV